MTSNQLERKFTGIYNRYVAYPREVQDGVIRKITEAVKSETDGEIKSFLNRLKRILMEARNEKQEIK